MDVKHDDGEYARARTALLMAIARGLRETFERGGTAPDEVRRLTEEATLSVAVTLDGELFFEESVIPFHSAIFFGGSGLRVDDGDAVLFGSATPFQDLAYYAVEEIYYD